MLFFPVVVVVAFFVLCVYVYLAFLVSLAFDLFKVHCMYVDQHLVSEKIFIVHFLKRMNMKKKLNRFACMTWNNFYFSIELLAFDLMKASNSIRYARIMYLKLICEARVRERESWKKNNQMSIEVWIVSNELKYSKWLETLKLWNAVRTLS